MSIYPVICLGGMLGIILHALKSMIAINSKNPCVNLKLVYKTYVSTEGFSFLVSVFCFAVLLFVSSEFVNYKAIGDDPAISTDLKDKLVHFQVANFIKVVSVICGYFSDSIVYGWLGRTEKNLKEKFGDTKTPTV